MATLIYNGDSLRALESLKAEGLHLPLCFADPPDNLGLQYNGMLDRVPQHVYTLWMRRLYFLMRYVGHVSWLSYYYAYIPHIMSMVFGEGDDVEWKQIIWRFTFGQNQQKEFGSGYRPLLRLTHPLHDLGKYITKIRVESERQRMGDSRANPAGRVPDDVWDFPRVTGNATERRPWHPTQHPEALLNRIVLSSGGTDLKFVCDCFAGTGSMLRTCQDLNIDSLGFEQSEYYCDMMSHSLKSWTITKNYDDLIDWVRARQ